MPQINVPDQWPKINASDLIVLPPAQLMTGLGVFSKPAAALIKKVWPFCAGGENGPLRVSPSPALFSPDAAGRRRSATSVKGCPRRQPLGSGGAIFWPLFPECASRR